ncbi:alpha/beta hydrolase-fold protein [Brevibacterium sp.]|uniref:alpha/beta hydrolase n=1 Tax=Brevibacterium sp. TaxID=1701 RepID=UPI0026291C54|nr:alpha/beta hydrolase-fold protein [Brevibacterium sp.]
MNGHGQTGETTELCTWTLDAERDLWRLGIVVAEEDIPTDRRPGDGQSLFADLNGIAGRTDVARGIMTRYEGPSGGGFAIDLDVPRGFRGGLHFMAVPAGLQSADRPTWLAALEGSFVPTRHPGLSTVRNMHGIATLAVAAPDAPPPVWAPPEAPPRIDGGRLPWTSGPEIGSDDVAERIVTLDSSPRRIWIHRPNRAVASAPVLVVFDGRGFVDGGLLAAIDEFDSPPSTVIAIDHERAEAEVADAGPGTAEVPDGESRAPAPNAGDARTGSPRPPAPSAGNLRADDLVMNPDFGDDVLDLVASIAPDRGVRALVAGASCGGLAAAYFALRHPQRFRGICLSPSFWQTDAAGRRIWDHLPDADSTDATVPDLVIDYGVLEPVIADSVAETIAEFADRGLEVEARSFVGGHEYLWWRDLLLGRLGEALGHGAPASLRRGEPTPLGHGTPASQSE